MSTRTITSLRLLDAFDRCFVEAVLRLRGITAEPAALQLRGACAQLDAYYAAITRAPEPQHDLDEQWLDGHTFSSAAEQLAFLFTQFGVLYVSQATAAQLQALNLWWTSGALPFAERVLEAA